MDQSIDEQGKHISVVADSRDTPIARIIIYAVLITIAYISVFFAFQFMLAQPLADLRLETHLHVIKGTAPKPVQYRILTYYIVEGLHRLTHLAIWRLDLILRFVFTSLALIFFMRYLRRWFDFTVSVIGALIMGAILPITYIDYIHQPHDIPNLFFTILALGLIRDKKEAWLLLLIPVAMLNRESFIFVLWVWLFYNFDRLPFKTLIVEFILFGFVSMIVYLTLPYYFGLRQNYVETLQIKNNLVPLTAIIWLWRLLMFVGPLTIAALVRFRAKPLFLRRSIGYVIIYMIANLFVGIYLETRLFLPILPIMIPLGLAAIFPSHDPDRLDLNHTIRQGE